MADLADRTLELIDIASESRDEAALAAHVFEVLEDGGVPVVDAGDTCVLAGRLTRGERPLVLLAGHLDTVPVQDNRPGRREGGAVHGLGASDMKGALAVMVELALAGADFGYVFFGREELPVSESSLTPLLEREPGLLEADLVLMMEPTDNAVQAGCLGNINARWTFHGVSGHSARPWLAENALEHAARGVLALAAVPDTEYDYDGLSFHETVSVTTLHGGIAENVIPDRAVAGVNYRYPPGLSAADAEHRLRTLCEGGELEIYSNAPSAPVAAAHPLVQRLREAGDLAVQPKQAWTPVAEFAARGLPAVNFGPGDPRYAHRRDEQIQEAALVRSYEVLERFACA
jgi:succinyl-diaminopimelate desuccinylase